MIDFWVAGVITLAVVLIVVLMCLSVKKPGCKHPDYYNIFLMGLIWIILGAPMKNYLLFFLGAIFVFVGLANRIKWRKPEVWNKLTLHEQISRIFLLSLIAVLAFSGFLIYWT